MSPIPLDNLELEPQYKRQLEYSRGGRLHAYRTAGIGNMRSILDVGCGAGDLTAELDRSCRGNAVGCDVDAAMVDLAGMRHPEIRFERSEPSRLPFQGREFDMACCHLTLMWADDPAALLAEMRRVVRPGGWVAALAEPDWGSGFYVPGDWVAPACASELRRQGAEPCMGRGLAALFRDAGFTKLIRGAINSVWDENHTREHAAAERDMVLALIGENPSMDRGRAIAWGEEFVAAALDGRATVFMPLFFCLARL